MSENKCDFPSQLFAGVGSRRKLLGETPEKEHEMNAAVDSEHNSDQHSKAIVLPPVNSGEKIDSSVADFPFDVKKPFSDAIQNYVSSNGKCFLNLGKRNLQS